jgi:hypothetical protein
MISLPQRGRVGVGARQLEAVLAGVAGAAGDHRDAGDGGVGEAEGADLGQRAAGEAVDQDRRGLGALHGDQRGGVGDVLEIDHAADLLAHPRHVLVAVRRVDDDEVLVLGALVEDAVVDDAAVGPAQERVDRLADRRRRRRRWW